MADRMRNLEDYKKSYEESIADPEKFWAEKADYFIWRKKWDKVLEWNFEEPNIKWFINGKLNITENCLDRHLQERIIIQGQFLRDVSPNASKLNG